MGIVVKRTISAYGNLDSMRRSEVSAVEGKVASGYGCVCGGSIAKAISKPRYPPGAKILQSSELPTNRPIRHQPFACVNQARDRLESGRIESEVCEVIRWIWLAVLGPAVSATASHVQTTLKPGTEPCDKAMQHASAAVLEAKHSFIAQAEPSESGLTLFGATIVRATDVYLHCEDPSTHLEQLEASIAHAFQARMETLHPILVKEKCCR